ncbi:VTS1 [[Candida] subhashii]|uniref:VTS1 n=1 Tax=[Candida] subhashii TaxID=561895 RepID=A0A8J5QQ79_9ASCO|nr:VTS1 [[Candida] subhashii]KAG7664620.1 VTS1 [[Candida] subhashii]
MDHKNTPNPKSPQGFFERPIILSPPPLEHVMPFGVPSQDMAAAAANTATNPTTTTSNNSTAPSSGVSTGNTSQRQQSIGYNLQHEFETLNADLDLDLKNNQQLRFIASHSVPSIEQQIHAASNNNNSLPALTGTHKQHQQPHPTKPGLLAPAASKYGMGSELLGTSSSGATIPILRESALSPIQPGNASGGLASLLNNGSSTTTENNTSSGGFLPPPLASIPNRPQSVNDFSNIFSRNDQQHHLAQSFQQQQYNQPGSHLHPQQHTQQPTTQSNFFSDLLVFSNWIENLNPQDTITMIEYLCNSLPVDILLTFKSKLDNHLQASKQQQQAQPQQGGYNVISGYNNAYSQDIYQEMEQLNLQDKVQQQQTQQLHQPKPRSKPIGFRQSGQYLNLMEKISRPRSAEPSLNNRYGGLLPQQQQQQQQFQQQQLDRAKSPTSHLFEKTNFLQLAATSNQPQHLQQHLQPQQSQQQSQQQQYGGNQSSTQQTLSPSGKGTTGDDPSLDLSSHLKLGALATINSRVALDSNRKHHPGGSSGAWNTNAPPASQKQQVQNRLNYEESINRGLNSSSVPANIHRLNMTGNNSNNMKAAQGMKKKTSGGQLSPPAANSGGGSGGGAGGTTSSSMPAEVTNIELLNNVPAWLKLLRLHKYTECLKDIPWRELIELDNDELEERGVAALGARRKLLKAFDVVKSSLEDKKKNENEAI